jgi:hypothetical protein
MNNPLVISVLSNRFIQPDGSHVPCLSTARRYTSFYDACKAIAAFSTDITNISIHEVGANGNLRGEQPVTIEKAHQYVVRNTAGYVNDQEWEVGDRVRFTVQRRTNSPYGTDTIDVELQSQNPNDLNISCASWKGSIEETKAFANALLQACELAQDSLSVMGFDQPTK